MKGKLYQFQFSEYRMVSCGYNELLTNTPVIFVHGFNASISFWESCLPVEFENLRWYSVSLPGHYPSSFPKVVNKNDFDISFIAELVVATIKKLIGPQQVLLVGHSTGALISLYISSEYPGLVKSVLSISGFFDGKLNGVLGLYQNILHLGKIGELYVKSIFTISKGSQFSISLVVRFFTYRYRPLNKNPVFCNFLSDNFSAIKKIDNDALIFYLLGLRKVNISLLIQKIEIPVWLITGNKDPIVLPKQSKIIFEALKYAEILILENVGHFPMWESNLDFERFILAWLSQNLIM